jgi:hypothetical protein
VERFWDKVDRSGDCWVWTGARRGKGYGDFWYAGKSVAAHRFSYELHVGPIADGLLTCHHCDNRRCVRPNHLFLGTHTDNMRDAKAKGRLRHGHLFGTMVGCARLNEQVVLNIRALFSAGVSPCRIAKWLAIPDSTVYPVVRRQTWTHI